ncbi:MAG: hypothetical protein D6689_18520 [Deltaproteobacteria bacterium]|nr:MAG: hypothetical protein D6689_18520 [Deltaproteobacteria bacterium]
MSDETTTLYTRVFLGLAVAMIVSVVIAAVSKSGPAIAAIFVIAAFKAYLVLNYFIHLGREPRYIKYVVIATLAALVILYGTLIPDIVHQFGHMEGAVR